ncbi:MAG: formate/nitrite transporter family protein [Chloroflexi bacterium]|jgi:formate/nitrite transporter|nr:formate/nitrite transporter family protein [Chloroflexota bacterium]
MPFKSPKAIVETACTAGCSKAELPAAKQLVLGFLAGAFIAFGGLLAIIVGKGSPALNAANPGLGKFVFGGVFPVGLMLVIIAGAELFTGNTGVITPACLTGSAKWRNLLRNWVFVYVGNFIGSVFVALFLAYLTGTVNGGDLGAQAAAIAEGKVSLNWGTAILRGIGCNWLVCLAVWMALAADDIAGKILAIWFPIMAFVTLGWEHSIANMFFIPLGMLNGANVTIGQFLFSNLLPVTIGNIIGGAVFVGGIYWWIYGRGEKQAQPQAQTAAKPR